MVEKYKYDIMPDENFISGFVAIVGAPNVGKSTLLNFMLGQKISITSKKPQTTRNRIIGVLSKPSTQFVFVDTPGIHQASGVLNTRIVDMAFSVIADVDLILLVTDLSRLHFNAERILIDKLKESKKSVILALNKIDKITRVQTLEMIKTWSKVYHFKAIVPICALTGARVESLMSAMRCALPVGVPLYPLDSLTDMSERFIVSELIREKVFRLTGQEIPYSSAVTIDSFEGSIDTSFVRIHSTIHVERGSQKGIIIGKNGKKIKQIGEGSRLAIQKLLGTDVFLKLFVRVQKKWSTDTRALKKFGY